MTPILQVISEYCSIYVDDIRLNELALDNSPLYSRKMWRYLKPAISLFNLPPEMQDYLIGTKDNPKLIEPDFADTSYTVYDEYYCPFIIDLGNDYKGYELCSCAKKEADKFGNIILTPISVTYDEQSGVVTIPASKENPVLNKTVFEFDFYTDGYFINTLSSEIMNILGMCFQAVWQDRFNTDWISNVSKIEDKSFFEQNRANKIKADGERLVMLREKLAGEMRRFEQNQYYKKAISVDKQLKI